MLFPNWSDYLKLRGDIKMGNKNSNRYNEVCSGGDTNNEAKLTILTNDPDTILLAANTEGTTILLHSFTNLVGGFLLHPKDTFVCHTGSGHVRVAIIVDETSAIACKTTTKIKALIDPDTFDEGDISYKGTNTFLPAPWLVDAILPTKSNDPSDLILVACTAASEFDNNAHDNDPSYLSTQDHLESFAAWAWGMKMG